MSASEGQQHGRTLLALDAQTLESSHLRNMTRTRQGPLSLYRLIATTQVKIDEEFVRPIETKVSRQARQLLLYRQTELIERLTREREVICMMLEEGQTRAAIFREHHYWLLSQLVIRFQPLEGTLTTQKHKLRLRLPGFANHLIDTLHSTTFGDGDDAGHGDEHRLQETNLHLWRTQERAAALVGDSPAVTPHILPSQLALKQHNNNNNNNNNNMSILAILPLLQLIELTCLCESPVVSFAALLQAGNTLARVLLLIRIWPRGSEAPILLQQVFRSLRLLLTCRRQQLHEQQQQQQQEQQEEQDQKHEWSWGLEGFDDVALSEHLVHWMKLVCKRRLNVQPPAPPPPTAAEEAAELAKEEMTAVSGLETEAPTANDVVFKEGDGDDEDDDEEEADPILGPSTSLGSPLISELLQAASSLLSIFAHHGADAPPRYPPKSADMTAVFDKARAVANEELEAFQKQPKGFLPASIYPVALPLLESLGELGEACIAQYSILLHGASGANLNDTTMILAADEEAVAILNAVSVIFSTGVLSQSAAHILQQGVSISKLRVPSFLLQISLLQALHAGFFLLLHHSATVEEIYDADKQARRKHRRALITVARNEKAKKRELLGDLAHLLSSDDEDGALDDESEGEKEEKRRAVAEQERLLSSPTRVLTMLEKLKARAASAAGGARGGRGSRPGIGGRAASPSSDYGGGDCEDDGPPLSSAGAGGPWVQITLPSREVLSSIFTYEMGEHIVHLMDAHRNSLTILHHGLLVLRYLMREPFMKKSQVQDYMWKEDDDEDEGAKGGGGGKGKKGEDEEEIEYENDFARESASVHSQFTAWRDAQWQRELGGGELLDTGVVAEPFSLVRLLVHIGDNHLQSMELAEQLLLFCYHVIKASYVCKVALLEAGMDKMLVRIGAIYSTNLYLVALSEVCHEMVTYEPP